MIKFQALLNNPHTRWAGIAYLVSKLGIQIAQVWFSVFDEKLRATAEIIEGAAVAYGLFAAGAGNVPLTQINDELQAKKEVAEAATK